MNDSKRKITLTMSVSTTHAAANQNIRNATATITQGNQQGNVPPKIENSMLVQIAFLNL